MEFKSTLNDVERFTESPTYDDMLATFEDWLVGAREVMEAATGLDEIWRCQGRIQVLKDIMLWAENFKGALEESSR